MSRRLRPLTSAGLGGIDQTCATCVFWESAEPLEVRCGAACDAGLQRSWFSEVHSEWGECGRVAHEDDEMLGFVKYAPTRYFAQARYLPSGVPDPDAPLIACLHVMRETRRRGLDRLLLQAALRDLHVRGERTVFAYGYVPGGDRFDTPMPDLEFLLHQGFVVERAHPVYPLLRLDLRGLASWTENLESALESLLLPLGRPQRLPTPSIE